MTGNLVGAILHDAGGRGLADFHAVRAARREVAALGQIRRIGKHTFNGTQAIRLLGPRDHAPPTGEGLRVPR